MVKTIIKEVLIVILICLALVLGLSIVFYNFNPSNKVVPNKISYTTSDEIKALKGETNVEDVVGEGFNVIFKIENADLQNYTKSNRYIDGKAHPFGESNPSIGDELDNTIAIPELEGDGGIGASRKGNTSSDQENIETGTGSDSNSGTGNTGSTNTTPVATPTPVKPK